MHEDESIELLVTRRPKRSTAGNRMHAALAEMVAEGIKDPEDDYDFEVDKEEEDVFESDFESADEEEAEPETEAVTEQTVHEEDRRERQAARSRLEKATAAAHARNRATFNPELYALPSEPSQKPKARRATVALDEVPDGSPVNKKRKSQRTTTVLNTTATVKRLKESQHNRALVPKKTRRATKFLTQAELIARALDNEEGNIIEHRDYLRIEEEKRKQARVVKQRITGSVLRWVSKIEEMEVPVVQEDLVPSSFSIQPPSSSSLNAVTSSVSQDVTQPSAPPTTFPAAVPTPMAVNETAVPALTSSTPPNSNPVDPPLERVEKVAKNYLIHEQEGIRKPSWNDSMKAMFGDHVKWDEIKVYVGKGRPLSRPIPVCCVTGQPAAYFDPRTGACFANVAAYKRLTGLLEQQYIWNPVLGCFVE